MSALFGPGLYPVSSLLLSLGQPHVNRYNVVHHWHVTGRIRVSKGEKEQSFYTTLTKKEKISVKLRDD